MSATFRTWPSAPSSRLATVRVLVCAYALVYLLIRAPVMASFSQFSAREFSPVGVVRLLSAPLPDGLVVALFVACLVSALAFLLGRRPRLSGPAFGLLLLWVTTYRNCFGMVFHSDNLLALHGLYLGLAPGVGSARLTSNLEPSDPAAPPTPSDRRAGMILFMLSAITVTTYVLAGVAKLKNSGMAWMHGEILRNYIAYDAVRKLSAGSVHSPVGAWLVGHAWPFPIIGWLTMVVELGAPLALMGKRLARAWTMAALAFHWGVALVMAIAFPYPLSCVAYASLLPVERIWRWRLLARIPATLEGVGRPTSRAREP